MNWKLKALITDLVSRLPSAISTEAYYQIQRHSGGLKKGTLNPTVKFEMAARMCGLIREHGRSHVARFFLEIGTGRRINLPVALWLCGAEKVLTLDITRLLTEELVKEDMQYIKNNQAEIRSSLSSFMDEHRFIELQRLLSASWRLKDLLKLCNIEYLAPGDATNLKLPSRSVDFQVSVSAFEHIPPDTLEKIINECNRVLKDDGLFINIVDFRDHFYYSDKTISPINFLQFSDEQWKRIAGNKFAYTNRFRIDDVLSLIKTSGQRILAMHCTNDDSVLDLIKNGKLSLHPKFKNKSAEELSTMDSWLISEKNFTQK